MSKIIEKWHEQKQEGATPKLLEEILDKNKLIEVKELWWSDPFYTGINFVCGIGIDVICICLVT